MIKSFIPIAAIAILSSPALAQRPYYEEPSRGTHVRIREYSLNAELLDIERTQLVFRVSERSYIAMFHVEPDYGIRMVYPHSYRSSGILLPAGTHHTRELIPMNRARTRRDGYIVLLASDSPLNLHRVRGHSWFNQGHTSALHSPRRVMDELSDLVVSARRGAGWDADWIDIRSPYGTGTITRDETVIYCDGRRIVVRDPYASVQCPRTRSVLPPRRAASPSRVPPLRRDTLEAVRPEPKSALPRVETDDSKRTRRGPDAEREKAKQGETRPERIEEPIRR